MGMWLCQGMCYYAPVSSKDLAYFDGLKEVILAVGLIIPKAGIFQEEILYLLILTTPQEIVILGVSFSSKKHTISHTHSLSLSSLSLLSLSLSLSYSLTHNTSRITY